jgi:subtilisin-like proprotein convertase family protein
MFTRCSKNVRLNSVEARFFLTVLIITAGVVLPCQSSPVVISRDFDRPIPSSGDQGKMEDAIIDVTEHISIDDLDIAISLTHEAFFDLEIILQRPNGKPVTLNPSLNYAFEIRDANNRLMSAGGQNRFLFDDEAAIGIENATPPFNQAFRPAVDSKLSAFDGQDAFGQWRLQINDLWTGGTGRLEGVELIINVPEPTSGCLFGLAIVVARLIRSRKVA